MKHLRALSGNFSLFLSLFLRVFVSLYANTIEVNSVLVGLLNQSSMIPMKCRGCCPGTQELQILLFERTVDYSV